MAPPTKRRKPQPQRYECHTCLSSRISSQFPDSNPTSECEHLINTCKRCLKAWVESQIETTGGWAFTPHILCPECEGRMGRGNVEGVVSGRSFKRSVCPGDCSCFGPVFPLRVERFC
jgi:ariadne-1